MKIINQMICAMVFCIYKKRSWFSTLLQFLHKATYSMKCDVCFITEGSLGTSWDTEIKVVVLSVVSLQCPVFVISLFPNFTLMKSGLLCKKVIMWPWDGHWKWQVVILNCNRSGYLCASLQKIPRKCYLVH